MAAPRGAWCRMPNTSAAEKMNAKACVPRGQRSRCCHHASCLSVCARTVLPRNGATGRRLGNSQRIPAQACHWLQSIVNSTWKQMQSHTRGKQQQLEKLMYPANNAEAGGSTTGQNARCHVQRQAVENDQHGHSRHAYRLQGAKACSV